MSSEKRRYELKARADSQRRTRERIVQATMELHQEVGPAQTTIAEIARRADVQRLTVYNHFPDEHELFGACQAHWLSLHPLPDLTAALALPDPVERVQRRAARLLRLVSRDRVDVRERPAGSRRRRHRSNEVLGQTADAGLSHLADALAAGFTDRGRVAARRRALIAVALDFWTWRRLDREGLDDDAAAAVMAQAVARAPSGH